MSDLHLRENWVAYKTIVIREVLRFMRIWIQTITPPAVNAFLYLVIFGNLIGRQIGEMGGERYIDYIVPGIIMMSVITNSYANVVSSFYSAKFQHSIEELLISPVHNSVILLGYISGGVCRGFVVGLVVTLVSLLFTRLPIQHLGVTFAIAVLTSALFAIGGFINAVFAKSFDDISIIPNFVLTPLTYLGGIFYSIELLPEFWQKVSLFNPVLYMINGFRYGFLGTADIDIVWAFGVILVFIVAFGTLALQLLNRGIGIKS
jgi:ABC-2 type transport system permease protein